MVTRPRARRSPKARSPVATRAPARNLADPDDEPTDEELAELMRSAFAGLREERERSLREMRARIAAGRAALLAEAARGRQGSGS